MSDDKKTLIIEHVEKSKKGNWDAYINNFPKFVRQSVRINTALILCAGFGKRLNPITLNTPKPLLEIKDVSMLERCINLIEKLGIQKILINTFYLKDQFSVFLNSKNFNIDIKIIEDGEHILDTGGGIQNMIKDSNENDFLIFNPDTVWNNNYKENWQLKRMYFGLIF